MAITVSFNGATIRKPGSYSKTVIDLGGNFPISPVGVVGLIGEAPRGKPGSAELIANNVFQASQVTALIDKYGPGSPIADAASLAFNPSNDGQIANGANATYIYKTNATTQASVLLPSSYGLVAAQEYGIGGNLVSLAVSVSTAESLPSLANLHFLPASSASGASDFQLSANGGAKQQTGVIAAYGAAAGGPDAFVTAVGGLTNLAATGGTATALFTGTDNTTTLTAANASGVTTFTLAVAGSLNNCAQGSLFVISGHTTASWNGCYLCTTASTASTISGVKLKDLSGDTCTLPAPGVETFSAGDTASRSFTAATVSETAAEANGQGASLQLNLANNNRLYGGTARAVLNSTAANVATIALSGSFASARVTLSGATWLSQPQAGDMVWILPDSQLAATSANCGAYYVTASSSTTCTMTKVNQSAGTFTAVSATLVSTQGVASNLRCFLAAQDTPALADVVGSAAESKRVFVISNTRDQVTETSDEIGGNVALQLGYANGAASAATCSINQQTSRLTTSVTGVSGVNLNINLLQFPTLQSLVNYLNAQPGYAAAVDVQWANVSPLNLDTVSALGILSLSNSPTALPGRIKKDVADVNAEFAQSSIASATITATQGLPAAMSTTFMAGGITGATSSAAILAALSEFEKVRINTIVPLFSRDASLDINESLTDASSTYLIDSIHAAVNSHCILMSNTKNRSERHCVLAARDSYVNVKKKAANLSSFRAQLVFQDVRALSTGGNLEWMQPHMLAAEVAGMRSGAVVGLPLTFKFFKVSGLRHTAQPLATPDDKIVIDFEPRTQYDDAIDAGLTFLEAPTSGGFRMVVDNTTYTKDDNWVYNRMATLHAADVVVFDFRTRLENAIVGARNTDFTAVSIRKLCEELLTGYKGQGLLGSTTDAPNGFSNLSVTLSGNTVVINAAIILVEGIDFVLNTITLKRNTQAA